MRTKLLALLFFWPMAIAASAQTAGDRYEAAYVKTGILLRASAVCGQGNGKRIVQRAFAGIAASDYQRFSRAYPDTTKKWMMAGAAAFNNSVMSVGVDAACKKVRP